MTWQETATIETELRALEQDSAPCVVGEAPSIAAAWRMGARYALAWLINRRGAELGPAAAAREFVGPCSSAGQGPTRPRDT